MIVSTGIMSHEGMVTPEGVAWKDYETVFTNSKVGLKLSVCQIEYRRLAMLMQFEMYSVVSNRCQR